ncbi:MAG: phenylacetate--CoA ligase family protein [Geminicoccaceae bacterium]|jgi:phenylacetate-CoA ligase|nr:phenylacetate--CoA ligase family protein [Geminicoccaceae bacterium]MCB9966082.1 phenylacetate--CoA ligase family protein [Geminicoccaceae bacterium]HRY26635.1 phenylacetate--CoA ligase family protein [Geminicoccaceae bacterium]
MAENGRTYFDRQEVREPGERERSIFHALPGLIRHAIDNAPFFREQLAGVEPDSVTSRRALARLPVARKAALGDRQRRQPPFGGLTATATGRLAHLFATSGATPGPVYHPEGGRSDYWRFARAMYAAGFSRGDLVLNCFSYHLRPSGFMADFGARALGCPVIPAGPDDPDRQVRIIAELAPVAFAGRPSVLAALLERAAKLKIGIGSLKKALLSGESTSEAERIALGKQHGIAAFQCYATADLGLVAYESTGRGGLIVDESVIVEIVRPGTGDPVPPGKTGEVLVTAFNPDYPLIRFATGDLAAVVPGESSCGRTNMRLSDRLGRVEPAEAGAGTGRRAGA